ncbi:hypothetical protein NC653_015404 [Populus alba x Populus x berolinensis]|uniref:Uncharacterized protein n=1 Tax=Populus alba x Populus x berolinensis TaxID=444605 RepID=A0AAD6QKJ6_9ROSI|nr:hypothetical protein NC653_015404 [Populus alba x Populus x berolinensis]
MSGATGVVQLRDEGEDEGGDRLALAGRCLLPPGFLSISPLSPGLSLSSPSSSVPGIYCLQTKMVQFCSFFSPSGAGSPSLCVEIFKLPPPLPPPPHAHVVKNVIEAHIVITFVCQQYLHIVMYLVEGQSVIYGEMIVVVVAEVGVTMCAEVYMSCLATR